MYALELAAICSGLIFFLKCNIFVVECVNVCSLVAARVHLEPQNGSKLQKNPVLEYVCFK